MGLSLMSVEPACRRLSWGGFYRCAVVGDDMMYHVKHCPPPTASHYERLVPIESLTLASQFKKMQSEVPEVCLGLSRRAKDALRVPIGKH